MNHSIPQSRFPLHIPRRRGFSFVEVLFAVMLLGIGFIMIAGVFPVAIEQTQITSNETSGALVARDAIRQLQAIAGQSGGYNLFPPITTGDPIVPIGITGNTPLATAIGTNGFFSADRRFSWAAFYSRNAADPFAQVFIVVLQNPDFQNTGAVYYGFPPSAPSTNYVQDTTANSGVPAAPVTPSPVVATFAYSPSTGNSYVYIYNTNYTNPIASPEPSDPVANAAPGAYVLISEQDPGGTVIGTPSYSRPAGALNGRFFKLAQPLAIALLASNPAPTALPSDVTPTFASLNTAAGTGTNPAPKPTTTTPVDIYQLEPGFDLKDVSETNQTAGITNILRVYILGRSLQASPNSANAHQANFTGPVQDITTVSSVIRINTAN